MYYKNGTEAQVGDNVVVEGGKTEGVVSDLIESETDMKEWGVEEKGLMIQVPEFGLVFWPETSNDPIKFLKRGQHPNQEK